MSQFQATQARRAKYNSIAALTGQANPSSAIGNRSHLLHAADKQQIGLMRQLALLRSRSYPQETLALLLHQQNMHRLHHLRVLESIAGPPSLALPMLALAGLSPNSGLLQGYGTISPRSLMTPVPLDGSPLLLPSATPAATAAESVASAGGGGGADTGSGNAAAAATDDPPNKRTGRSSVFPHLLHCVLADLEAHGRTDIASFLPHGRAFMIHKPLEFEMKVMPKYFRMGHFTSFQRQLNLYEFQRITRGADKVRDYERHRTTSRKRFDSLTHCPFSSTVLSSVRFNSERRIRRERTITRSLSKTAAPSAR